MSPGFGRGKFGDGGFGEWNWSRYAFVEGIPDIYLQMDEEDGDGLLRGLLESVSPSMDAARRKIRDYDILSDPLKCPTENDFKRDIRVLKAIDLGDGTSRVFVSEGEDVDKLSDVTPGMNILDSRGMRFRILQINSSDAPDKHDDPPTDPDTSSKTGKNVIVRNISFANIELVPYVSGDIVEDEDISSSSPPIDGNNEGPYSFAVSNPPVARNRVEVAWLEDNVRKIGYFNNDGAPAGDLSGVSSIDYDTGDITILNDSEEPIDSWSVRVTYTIEDSDPDEDAQIRAQNILTFLGKDYGLDVDVNDPDHLQRSYVYHSHALWDDKGTADGYANFGKMAGYRISVVALNKISETWLDTIPGESLFEIPEGSGNFFTDIDPNRQLFDEVKADVTPLDLLCTEDDYPEVTQSVFIENVELVHHEGTRSVNKVTASTSSMHESFGEHGTFTDSDGADFNVRDFSVEGTDRFSFIVSGITTPSEGSGTVTWKVFRAVPEFTIDDSHIKDIGIDQLGGEGRRYRITREFSDPYIASVGNWVLIDSDGIQYDLEKFRNISGDDYRMEIISDSKPSEGLANIFYRCPIVTDCTYCRASGIIIRITPDEILDHPESMGGDPLGRLIARMSQMVPIHVRILVFAFDPGPSVASFNITAFSEIIEDSESLDNYTAFYDTDNFSELWDKEGTLADSYNADSLPISVTSEVTVSVTSDPPDAGFSHTVNGYSAEFTDDSTPYTGVPIVRWNWDFDDGRFSSEQNPTHVYEENGTYSVTLTITDANNKKDSYTDSVSISA